MSTNESPSLAPELFIPGSELGRYIGTPIANSIAIWHVGLAHLLATIESANKKEWPTHTQVDGCKGEPTGA